MPRGHAPVGVPWPLTNLLVVSTVLVLVASALWCLASWGARRPFVHKTTASGVSGFLRDVLRRGYAGGTLILSVRRTELFVQFRKYIGPSESIGLEFCFPRAAWSEPYYGKLLGALADREIPFRRERVEDPVPGGVSEFVMVDCGATGDRALELTRLTLLEVFGCSSTDPIEARLQGVSVHDELVSTGPTPTSN
jgi:hypothetical protein